MKEQHNIWISDLTHTAQGISANTFPLGASYVFSYAKQELGKEFNFKLFKFPKKLSEALNQKIPKMLCFSNFSWNFELSYKFAKLAKERDPTLITVFGGPNFPTDLNEKAEFLMQRPAIDFYIELEGELGFVDLIKNLMNNNFEAEKLKKDLKKINNTCYLYGDQLITGPIERIKDVNIIPSPYLNGAMDEYFDLPLIPMMETTRGCPFSCTFCADGLAIKSKIHRYYPERIKEELYYISKKVKNMDELIITDLNFGMYKQDIVTAKVIAETQEKYNYPVLLGAAAGKNMPKRTIEIGNILKGWTTGASIQSSDPEVLKAIKRSNISTEAYKEIIDHGNNLEGGKTHSEIILGLPGDTREKHFESIRFGIDNDVKQLRMFQAIMLYGTEMASKNDRIKFGLKTKFRTIPGSLGNYEILGKNHSIAEIEEIIISSSSLSPQDYIDCRIMNLIVETFYNNHIFEEIYSMLKTIKVSVFDALLYIKEHSELYSEKINKIIDSFVTQTTQDLYDTWEDANKYVLTPEILEKYIGGELGTNELLLHRALLFSEFDDICNLIFSSVKGMLAEKKLLTKEIDNYLANLQKFILMRKKDPLKNTDSVKSATFNYDFELIKNTKYRINPNSISGSKTPLKFNFFHDKKQKEHISNQLKLYSGHAIGLGKLLQQTNINLIFRNFIRN